MKAFFRRYWGIHLWFIMLAVLFGCYRLVISHRELANTVVSATQVLKDAFSALWYLVPFSVVEWLYVLFILGAIVWIIALVVQLIRRGNRFHTAYRFLALLACTSLSVWWFYCMTWGVNYYADGFQEKSGIYAEAVSVDELERTALHFARELATLSSQVERDESGVFSAERDEIFAAAPSVYDAVSKEFPFLTRIDRIPKKMLFSRLFSMMNFTGFYTPFTGESNLNVDSPVCLLPANIAHELAHQRGIASEQECNFLAILAATTCDDVNYRYSGYLMGYIHLGNALYRADRDRWQAVYDLLPKEVIADLRYHSSYWAQFDGVTATVSQKIYDTTLKGYGQSNGIKSYGTVVDLLVAYY